MMRRSRENERRSERRDEGPRRGPKTPPEPGPSGESGSHEGGRPRSGSGRSAARRSRSRSPRQNRSESRRGRLSRSRSGSSRNELRKVDDLSAEIAHLRQQCAEKERNLQKMYNQLERPGSPRRWNHRPFHWNRQQQQQQQQRGGWRGFRQRGWRNFGGNREGFVGEPIKQTVAIKRDNMSPYNIPLDIVQYTKTLPSLMFSCSSRVFEIPDIPAKDDQEEDWDAEMSTQNLWQNNLPRDPHPHPQEITKAAASPPAKVPEVQKASGSELNDPKESPSEKEVIKMKKNDEKVKSKKSDKDIEKTREEFLVKNTVLSVKKEAEKKTQEELRKIMESTKKEEMEVVKEVIVEKEVKSEKQMKNKKEVKEHKEVKEQKKSSGQKKMKPAESPSVTEKPAAEKVEAKPLEKKPPVPKKIGLKRKKSFSSTTSTSTTSTSGSSSSSSDSDSDSDSTSSSSSSSTSSSDSSSSSAEKVKERIRRKKKIVPKTEEKKKEKKEKEKKEKEEDKEKREQEKEIQQEVKDVQEKVEPELVQLFEVPKPEETKIVQTSREIECHTPPLPPQMINISPAKRTPIVLKLQGKVDKVTPTRIQTAIVQDVEEDTDFTETLRAKSKSPSEDSDAKLVTTTCGPEVEEQAMFRMTREVEEELSRGKRRRYRSPSRQSSASRRHRSPLHEKSRRSSRSQRRFSPSPERSRRRSSRRDSPPLRRRRSSPRSSRRRRRSRSRSWTRSPSRSPRSRSRSRSRSISRERGHRRRSPWRPPSVTGLSFLTDKTTARGWAEWDTVYDKATSDRAFYAFDPQTFTERRPEVTAQWTAPPMPVSPPHRATLDERISSALSEVSREIPERQNAALYQQNYHHHFPTYTGTGFPRPYHSANEYSHYTESIYHHNNLQQQMIDPNFQACRPSSNLISIPQVEQLPKPPSMLQKGNVIEVVPTTVTQEAAILAKIPHPPQNTFPETASPSSMAKKPFFPPLGTRPKVTKTAEQRKVIREKKRLEKKMRKKKLEFEIKQLLSGAQSVEITSEEILPEVSEMPVKENSDSVSVVKKVIFSDGVVPGASSSDSGVSSSDESISPETLTGMTANQLKKYRKQRKRKKKELNKENSMIADKVETLPPVRDPRRQPETPKNGTKEEDTTNYPPPSPPPGDPPPHMVQPTLKREVQERPKKLLYFNAIHREKRMDIFSIYVPPSAFVKIQDPRLLKHPQLNRRRIAAPLFPANVYPRPPQPYPHLPPVQVSPAAGIRAPPVPVPAPPPPPPATPYDSFTSATSRIPVLTHPSPAVPPFPPPPLHPPPPIHPPPLPPPPMHCPPPHHFPPGAYYVNNGPIPPGRY